jgi:hypothetical protein
MTIRGLRDGRWEADVGTHKDDNRTRRRFTLKREAEEFERQFEVTKATKGIFVPDLKKHHRRRSVPIRAAIT